MGAYKSLIIAVKKENVLFRLLNSKGTNVMPTSFINKSNSWPEYKDSKVYTVSFHRRHQFGVAFV